MNQRPLKSIDGIIRPPARPRSVYISHDHAGHPSAPTRLVSLQPRPILDIVKPTRPPTNPDVPTPAVRRPPVIPNKDVVVKLPRQHSLRARLSSVLQYIALAGIALLAAYSTGIGQYFVLAYAGIAFILRRSSALSFGIALFVLVFIPLFQLLQQPGVANNMAVYVYELLVVGTLQAIIELRWPAKDSVDIKA